MIGTLRYEDGSELCRCSCGGEWKPDEQPQHDPNCRHILAGEVHPGLVGKSTAA